MAALSGRLCPEKLGSMKGGRVSHPPTPPPPHPHVPRLRGLSVKHPHFVPRPREEPPYVVDASRSSPSSRHLQWAPGVYYGRQQPPRGRPWRRRRTPGVWIRSGPPHTPELLLLADEMVVLLAVNDDGPVQDPLELCSDSLGWVWPGLDFRGRTPYWSCWCHVQWCLSR